MKYLKQSSRNQRRGRRERVRTPIQTQRSEPKRGERIVRIAEVLERLKISRGTLWRWQQEGRFPSRRRIGPGIVGWFESEIEAFLESRQPVRAASPPGAD